MVEPNATEEAGIAKDQRPLCLMKNEMVVLLRAKSRWFHTQLARHAEMDPDPAPNVFASPDYFGVAAGELEEHLFSPGERAEKAAARELASERPWIRPAKDAFLPVELHPHNFLAEPGIPLPAIEFDFSQLRHRGK